jgi:iron complex transport system ATP-binding protein
VSSEPTPPLSVRDLTVRFGSREALSGVNLDVRAGEFLALAGPNGSGKTTLIRAVLGFVAPAAGSITLLGDDVAGLRTAERARRVAWVPQDEPARDNVPLLDYVLYGRYAHRGMLEGESIEDRRLAVRLLEEVGLADRASDGILSISGGERQRAILARAFAQEAPLLLLDEPTSHLDIAHQLDVLARVQALSRLRGTTVIAALHDLNLAARFSDRIVVLSHGRVVASGPPREVISREILRRVWGVSAELRRDPRTGVPFLIPYPLPPEPRAPPGSLGTVHVVGGGGAASPYLRALSEQGYRLSAGALPLFDTDCETAESLAIPFAEEVPFAPLGPEARERHRLLLDAAAAIVVAPFAVGPSNLANLEDLRPFARRTPIWLVSVPPIGARDFTEGRAAAVYRELLADGAREVESVDRLLADFRSLPAGGPALPDAAAATTAGEPG